MSRMARDEIPELRKIQDAYDRADAARKAGVEKAFADGENNARIARSVDLSREYIGRWRKKWEAGQKVKQEEKFDA